MQGHCTVSKSTCSPRSFWQNKSRNSEMDTLIRNDVTTPDKSGAVWFGKTTKFNKPSPDVEVVEDTE
jgi:hypothetical protein